MTQAAQQAQCTQRIGAAVDQVAEHDQLVARWREADLGEQAVEGIAAALHVADEEDHDGVALLVFLILLNGAFAMSEMALTASRKARLQVMVEAKEPGASAAMALHDNPTRWLSTVQVGITSIGILNGIVGEAAFAEPFARCGPRPAWPTSAPRPWWWPASPS